MFLESLSIPMKQYLHRLLKLDYRRVEEAVNIHFPDQPERMLSILRTLIPLYDVPQLEKIITIVNDQLNDDTGEIVGRNDRFYEPSSSGYSDLKYLVQDQKNGFISMARVVHVPFELSSFFSSLENFWQIRKIKAQAMIRQHNIEGPVAIVTDNYLKDDDNSCFLVTGFPEKIWASNYAFSRMTNNLKTLRPISSSTDDLKFSWMMLGEDVATIDIDGSLFINSPNISAIIAELPISRGKDYWEIEEMFEIKKYPILL